MYLLAQYVDTSLWISS